jgi:hypothetical protein
MPNENISDDLANLFGEEAQAAQTPPAAAVSIGKLSEPQLAALTNIVQAELDKRGISAVKSGDLNDAEFRALLARHGV